VSSAKEDEKGSVPSPPVLPKKLRFFLKKHFQHFRFFSLQKKLAQSWEKVLFAAASAHSPFSSAYRMPGNVCCLLLLLLHVVVLSSPAANTSKRFCHN
jgi:hypothetical protein